MSIPVAIDEIEATAAGRGHPFLLVQGPQRPKVLHTEATFVAGTIRCVASGSTARLAGEHPAVVLLWPASEPDGFSLIVDGDATPSDGYVSVVPTSAVLHRPARA